MRPLALALGLALLHRATQAIQTPFQTALADIMVSAPDSLWDDLSARPDTNWTGHLIFDSVNSLLQHWPNTRYRNGKYSRLPVFPILPRLFSVHPRVQATTLSQALLPSGRSSTTAERTVPSQPYPNGLPPTPSTPSHGAGDHRATDRLR